MNTIYVVGHKNPDTDSIVAAMAYAALRNASGDREYTAAQFDHCNDETKRVLARFGYEQPLRITDVRTQVADIDFDTPPTLNPSSDASYRMEQDERKPFQYHPQINPDGTLYGTLSSSDIANYNMSTIDATAINSLPLSISSVLLKAKSSMRATQCAGSISGEIAVAFPGISITRTQSCCTATSRIIKNAMGQASAR